MSFECFFPPLCSSRAHSYYMFILLNSKHLEVWSFWSYILLVISLTFSLVSIQLPNISKSILFEFKEAEYKALLFAKCLIHMKSKVVKKGKLRVTQNWMRDSISLFNSVVTNQNEYVCLKCYMFLNKNINDFEPFVQTNQTDILE